MPAAAVATLKALEQENADQPAAVALLRARVSRARRPRAAARAAAAPRTRVVAAGRARRAREARPCKASSRAPDLTSERLAEVWGTLPSELRSAPAVVAERARALARLGRGDEAERELTAALKREWHPALVHSYGEVRGADPAKQLKQAETWLKTYPDDAALLLAAARLSMANELWGKARSYLESSLAWRRRPTRTRSTAGC